MERGKVPSRGNSDDESSTAPDPPHVRREPSPSRGGRTPPPGDRCRDDLFLTVGYGATSINEIARAADVSPQMIYASFGSKAGILAKLADVVGRR